MEFRLFRQRCKFRDIDLRYVPQFDATNDTGFTINAPDGAGAPVEAVANHTENLRRSGVQRSGCRKYACDGESRSLSVFPPLEVRDVPRDTVNQLLLRDGNCVPGKPSIRAVLGQVSIAELN